MEKEHDSGEGSHLSGGSEDRAPAAMARFVSNKQIVGSIANMKCFQGHSGACRHEESHVLCLRLLSKLGKDYNVAVDGNLTWIISAKILCTVYLCLLQQLLTRHNMI